MATSTRPYGARWTSIFGRARAVRRCWRGRGTLSNYMAMNACWRCLRDLAGDWKSGWGKKRRGSEVEGGVGRGRRDRWAGWSVWLVPVAAMVLIAGTLLMTSSSRNWPAFKSQHAVPAKNIPPDIVVVVSSGAKLFHVPGCKFIHDKASQ